MNTGQEIMDALQEMSLDFDIDVTSEIDNYVDAYELHGEVAYNLASEAERKVLWNDFVLFTNNNYKPFTGGNKKDCKCGRSV